MKKISHFLTYFLPLHFKMIFNTYHSTSEKNIPSLLEHGFQDKFIGQKGGFGLIYGRGVYTSQNLKYVSTYHPECNKVIMCEINTDNYITIRAKDYTKKSRWRYEDYDLLIVEDINEYVCKNLEKIKITEVISVRKTFEKDMLVDVRIEE